MSAEVSAIICAVIAALSAVAVAIVEARTAKDRRSTQIRAERREKESRLSMELMSATCELSVVTAVALRDHHTNGNLQPALDKAKKAQDSYQSFLRDEAAHAVAKI